MNLDFRNTNALWCSVAAETLARAGVRHAVISPGSRNTPLTLALVAHPDIETIPVLDERSAGFFGLGLAKRTGVPVILLCTSGSAGAHYLPALIEAKESGVPLIAITADRPPELRDCASGQTVDQQKLFGGYVGFFHELAVPEARVELLQYLRQTLRHAVERARSGGPVHLNAPFRDPLVPVVDGTAQGLAAAVDWARFFALPPIPPQAHPREQMFDRDFAAAPGVIVCGAGWGEEVETVFWAERLGWPILADALSPLRFRGAGGRAVIAAYDAILRDPRAAQALRPKSVLILGEIPTSKPLRAWLTQADADTIQIGRTVENRDGRHGRTLRIAVGAATVNRWTLPHGVTPQPEWLAAWTRAEAAAQAVLAGAGDLTGFEGGFTRALARTLRRGQALFVASSMPVRDLESFAPARGDGPAVYANRGANGIDGTLSTALGLAHGGVPTVLLTGDLAFLHDTNGLLSAAKLQGSLTVVLINNAGGGIFGHLPIAGFNPPFEEYWATPQRVDFARLCTAYGVPHEGVGSAVDLATRLEALVGVPGLRVLEVRTDRARDVEMRRDVLARAATAVGEAFG
ncbi:2-succinyl-5-enolpyruvyl-6-hydroxy-3-cyclohexene-1-carboxylic-acid synthase [bacterium]|nr:2-succinyl-5-enolpyruvyl-6-hydroxy-3-cyclohexene-1-carboxylic-acid synthase [bacterium]